MDWKLALVQHPMYFLIREDSQCAERTPPWGEPSIELYCARVAQNLESLRQHPGVRIGYEWSGLELELLAKDASEVFRDMCALAREGRIAFYNGTYAQPHLQTLSSEANWRQFEFGARVYRELCDVQQVEVYAHQEASVHDQVPQLLQAFGIRYAVVPSFSSTLGWIEEGELNIQNECGPRFVQGHEFAVWRGLDGSEVPLYLHQPRSGQSLKDFIASETMAGRLGAPRIQLAVPDLIAVDDRWIAEHGDVDLVLLNQSLPERLRQSPPRARARFYTNWSYIEGIRAEELSRANFRAESAILRAEALGAMALLLAGRPAACTDRIWKNVLATQHHDVYCFCAPELRGKAVGWLHEAEAEAELLAREAAGAIADCIGLPEAAPGQAAAARPLIFFGTLPHPQRSVVTVDCVGEAPVVTDAEGRNVPAQFLPRPGRAGEVSFIGETNGLGYRTYWLRDGGKAASEAEVTGELTFENASYRAIVQPDGTFSSLALLPSGEELLDSRRLRGNLLMAMDSTGLSPRHEGMAPHQSWQRPGHGPELRWEALGPTQAWRSPLGVVLSARGRMGDKVTAEVEVRLYHEFPRIDLMWVFEFDTACIGTFYDDETKLRVHWPLAFDGEIYHDIAFGAVRTWEERTFTPANWTDVSDGRRGLAYFHCGTPKHWVSRRTLVNLFAWGEDTNAMGSRLWRYNWPKAFDQRLRGRHEIHCAVFPHAGDWRAADVIRAARDYATPPMPCISSPHAGRLPQDKTMLSLAGSNLVATAVKVDGSEIMCRVYSASDRGDTVPAGVGGVQSARLRSLSGDPTDRLAPFQIGEVILGG